MNRKFRILIVEDDMIIAANLSLQLTKLGYEVTGIESRGEEALYHAQANGPDIVLMDVNLKGEWDGIETVRRIQETRDIPIVYLTANNDENTFLRAKSTHPHAFISIPAGIVVSLSKESLNCSATNAIVLCKLSLLNGLEIKACGCVLFALKKVFSSLLAVR